MRKKREKTKVVMTVFIVVLMVGSVAGFLVGYSSPTETQDTFDYKGHTITRTNQGYVTEISGRQLLLVLDPQIGDNIPSDQVSITEFNSANKIYLTVHPEDNLNTAMGYFHRSINPYLQFPLFQACVEDLEGPCVDLPIKTCEDATNNEKIVFFQVNEEETSVSYINNCLTIQGSNDLVAPTQKAIQQLLGVV